MSADAKNFYMDVEVVALRRVRVDFVHDGKPTKEQMLRILNEQEYNDITDEEDLEFLEVRAMEEDGEEELDDSDDEDEGLM